jgi:lambda repressor-like predicted transcriptional regulator
MNKTQPHANSKNTDPARTAERCLPWRLRHVTNGWIVWNAVTGEKRSRHLNRADALTERAQLNRQTKPQPGRIRLISAEKVCTHIAQLRDAGVGLRELARVSNVSRTTLERIADRKLARVHPSTADRIIAATATSITPTTRVDAGPTITLLHDLIARGHSRASLARLLGCKGKHASLQFGSITVSASNACKVRALHETLTNTIAHGKLAKPALRDPAPTETQSTSRQRLHSALGKMSADEFFHRLSRFAGIASDEVA